MARRVEIAYETLLHGKPLRFVRSPVADIDAPWIVVADMLRAAGLDGDMLSWFSGTIRDAAPVERVMIGDAIAQIAPSWTMVLLFDAIDETDTAPRDAVLAAYRTVYAHLSLDDLRESLLSCPTLVPPVQHDGL